jgi:hypothetical protein
MKSINALYIKWNKYALKVEFLNMYVWWYDVPIRIYVCKNFDRSHTKFQQLTTGCLTMTCGGQLDRVKIWSNFFIIRLCLLTTTL